MFRVVKGELRIRPSIGLPFCDARLNLWFGIVLRWWRLLQSERTWR